MTTDTQKQFSIAEKEEIVAQLREKYAMAKREAAFAEIEKKEANDRAEAAWKAVSEAHREYLLCEQALIEEMSKP